MKCPKISVVIPVYNGEKTLSKCLDSVLYQTYKNYEVIVVDNNSTDRTKDIIKEFCKRNNKVKYVFEGYRSRGAARNKGVLTSRGEIIAMTDSDCIVPPNWLSEITKPIRQYKEFIVQGTELSMMNNYWTNMHQKAIQQFFKKIIYNSCYIDYVDTKNFAIQKEILLINGLFNKYIKNSEDFELRIRFKKLGYKNYFVKKTKVSHFHKKNFYDLICTRINQGYWDTMIYFLHKDFFDKHLDETIKTIHLLKFLTFFPWLGLFFIKKGGGQTFFELVTGIAWRIGVICGFLNKRRFLKINQDNKSLRGLII